MRAILAALCACLLAASAAQAAEIELRFAWDPNPESDQVDGYRLYYAEKSGGPYVWMQTFPGRQTTSGAASVLMDPGERLFFVLTAFRGALESGYSNEVSFFLPDDPGGGGGQVPPSSPRGMRIEGHVLLKP